MALADEPLKELLDRVAARTPAPASGSAAAITCAMAAALLQMATAYEPGSDPDSESPREAGRRAALLRLRAQELAQSDLTSYRPVLDALRRGRDDPGRDAAVAAALSEAASVPFEIAQISAEVSVLAADATARAGRHALGDATTAAVLAAAASRAAAMLVSVNLAGAADDRPEQAAEFVQQADVASQQALARARGG